MAHSSSSLIVNLESIVSNWRLLGARLKGGVVCSAVVKANAYGLGIKPVANALAVAGCREFFVATLSEGLELREQLPSMTIYVLHGCEPGLESVFVASRLTPVLVSESMVRRWVVYLSGSDAADFGVAIKVNTGMNRLGLSPSELDGLLDSEPRFFSCHAVLVMSHLACAEDGAHQMNRKQLDLFQTVVNKVQAVAPNTRASLANSSGIFLGEDWHFDLVRPGAALYGVNPVPQTANPMSSVVCLRAAVLQVRRLLVGESVGYGARFIASQNTDVAILAGGYADGIFRSGSNSGFAAFAGYRLPIVGVISMDALAVDITSVPAHERPGEGDLVELIGNEVALDDVAEKAGTIGYEVLTRLGQRFPWCYVE